MNRTPGRRRIIRAVTKLDSKGRPREARDRRTFLTARWVRAMAEHQCEGDRCVLGEGISPPWAYIQITDAARFRSLGWRSVPEVRKYHISCVPPRARPLLRLLRPGYINHINEVLARTP